MSYEAYEVKETAEASVGLRMRALRDSLKTTVPSLM